MLYLQLYSFPESNLSRCGFRGSSHIGIPYSTKVWPLPYLKFNQTLRTVSLLLCFCSTIYFAYSLPGFEDFCFSICSNPPQTINQFDFETILVQSIPSHQEVCAFPCFISLIQAALIFPAILRNVFFTAGITSLSPERHSFWPHGIPTRRNLWQNELYEIAKPSFCLISDQMSIMWLLSLWLCEAHLTWIFSPGPRRTPSLWQWPRSHDLHWAVLVAHTGRRPEPG